jgi:hypothetical protein
LNTILDSSPVHFIASTNLDAIFAKLQQFTNEPAEHVKLWLHGEYINAPKNSLDISPLLALMPSLSPEKMFPLLDIIRLAVLNKHIRSEILNSFHIIIKSMETLLVSESIAGKLMLLKLLCNLFDSLDDAWLTESNRKALIDVVVDGLLKSRLRQPAVMLAFNLAIGVLRMPLNEELRLEIVAALMDALSGEVQDLSVSSSQQTKPDFETLARLLSSITLLLYQAPEEVVELANLVDLSSTIESVRLIPPSRDQKWLIISKLCDDVLLLIQ